MRADRSRRLGVVAAAAGIALSTTRPAHAVDPFEIQVYDATANGPGVPGLELHLNSVLDGLRTAPPPEYPQNHQTHFTLEPSLGVTPWWELGGYFQMALRGDGAFDYGGVKIRSKFVRPPTSADGWRYGVNFELSRLPQTYDHDRWGGEIRPMLVWEGRHWEFAVNPIVDLAFAGSDSHEAPMFEPAASAVYIVPETLSFGLEYYSNVGPIDAWVPWRRQEQYLFEVVNVLAWKRVEINAGIGEGWTDGSNDLVAKMILGFAFEKESAEARPMTGAIAALRRPRG